MQKYHKFTPEEIQFLRDNLPGRTYAEMMEFFNRHFGLSITFKQMKNVIYYYKLHNGMPQHRFKLGQKNECYVPIGTERIEQGYMTVKTADYERWKTKNRLIWEAANGPILEGHAVIFADGNKSNLSLDNLLLVYRSELGVMNRMGLIFPDKELTKTGKAIAGMILLIAERERETGARRAKEKKE
jgi:hypothetical protein